jgi:hypothetical protein
LAQKEDFLDTRSGAVVGKALADRFSWRIGDKIPLQATICPHRDHSNAWTFDLVGTFNAAQPELRGMEQRLLFHYGYFDEGRQVGQGTVSWYIVRGVGPSVWSLRPQVRITGGWRVVPGLREVIVGRSALVQFEGFELGNAHIVTHMSALGAEHGMVDPIQCVPLFGWNGDQERSSSERPGL